MKYNIGTLREIFAKTDGRCHICWNNEGVIYFNNYGKRGVRGVWEVDHSLARIKGGSCHLNNLFPAHHKCNCSKGAKPIRIIRARYGYLAPHYLQKRRGKFAKQMLALGL